MTEIEKAIANEKPIFEQLQNEIPNWAWDYMYRIIGFVANPLKKHR
jgi:hypothetical protein